ncbi:hypothetical protein EGJ23_01380 [Pseudomonas sp. o96-267]|uniref:hypothetical protein n=1 Tax=Pseudomonas sp. o96-267 TaxID=2479853 RepID=UPI000F7AB6FC|nr:hypothetical protein [Pseudomonas sp. o96-267]RRV29617.1 hypothetical protein EGJ23_01380 [Pseudomonas sp. o96-267]
MNKQCVNCPGAVDHTTAECPVMVEASAPIDPIHSAMMLGMTPEPCEPVIEITRQAVTKLLDVVEFGDQLERVEKDRLVAFVKDLLAEDQPELWATYSPGPGEAHPCMSKEHAEREAKATIEVCEKMKADRIARGQNSTPWPKIVVEVIPSPFTPLEHFELLAKETIQHRDDLVDYVRELENKLKDTPEPAWRALIRLAMNMLSLRNHVPGSDVDLCVRALADLLEGKHSPAPEPSEAWRQVAEIARAEAPAVVNQQVTTAELTSVRCQCCQADHAADSYDAGFIAGSGMCQVCDSAMPPKDLPAAVSAGVEEVEVVGYRFFHVNHGYIFRRTHIYEGNPSLEAHSLMTVAQHRRILDALINTPHTDEWFDAVRLEAAHQIQRWGTDHDAGKQPADWFWLLGYLGQKAMTAQIAGDEQKAKHHTISSGAMLLNWFRAMVGDTNAMRPGIAQDQQEVQP